ncbi:PIN domain-containing protein [Aquihabitans sp. McL0605]|uniref:PIN domain-containing protein n=1 Tax=Aquihabitans sp. McL0605 TaxID=3415671 RepID=UPI003CF73747
MVLDASALLAFLNGEKGDDVVERALEDGAVAGAANWSEVAQKVAFLGRDWPVARAVLESYGISVEPVTAADAERAAERWVEASELSLADRLCLALADRLQTEVMTADRAWGKQPPVRQIR